METSLAVKHLAKLGVAVALLKLLQQLLRPHKALVKKVSASVLGLGAAAVLLKLLQHLLRPRKKLIGKMCVITGAGNGVGREAAIRFAKEGCDLVLWDINGDGLSQTQKLIKEVAPEIAVHTDNVNLATRSAIYDAARRAKEFAAPDRHVSILVNNAGIMAGKHMLETPDEDIIATFNTNSLAHFWTCKAFLPDMIAKDDGNVAFVSSASGLTSVPLMVPYSASKHAVVGLAHGMRKELQVMKCKNVHCSLICPAKITTQLFEGFEQPLLPAMTPEEVAHQIVEAVCWDKPYVVLPRSFVDPALRLPTWMSDKLELWSGMSNMNKDTKLGYASDILKKISKS